MENEQHIIELAGCAPIPLAHYLKALGILRLVSEQVDSEAKGWWKNDAFWLRSTLDRKGLIEFFLNQYQPTPIVAPWNGGSGFYANDSQEALKDISASTSKRLKPYREIIDYCSRLLKSMVLAQKPESEKKAELLLRCRNEFPDESLPWLDAAFVITQQSIKYPPLLGTGGNDGRLEFTNNYMQRLCELISPVSGEALPGTDKSLRESLFMTLCQARNKSPIGQFDPGSAGGANAASGFDGASSINNWDYLLMLEGSLVFAAATVKRLEETEPGVLAYPFCVQPSGVGYGSADGSDESSSRSEMWFPLWDNQVSSDELMVLLAEGRVVVHNRRARDGVDFARAIASLGIDRGITSFCRYGFQQRNGLAYFAVPLERFHVRENKCVEEILAPISSWLDRFRRTATSNNAPARAGRALRRLEVAIFELCRWGQPIHVQNTLVALGEAEATVAISSKLRDPKTGISPLPLLSAQWLINANDHSIEYRLAAALSSVGNWQGDPVGPLRRHLEPIDSKSWNSRWPKWAALADDPNIVWGGGGLIRNLLAILRRRIIEAIRQGKQTGDNTLLFPGRGCCNASLGDIADFIKGRVDDNRIEALLQGLMLVNWRDVNPGKHLINFPGPHDPIPDAAYAMIKLCHLPNMLDDKIIPLTPSIIHRATSGNLAEATRLASRRLKGSGFSPLAKVVSGDKQRALRTAAAILFPIWQSRPVKKTSVGRLMEIVLPSKYFDIAEEDNVTTEQISIATN
ncbi:MAG: type I-U CRISPR-associated protein Csx17 [Pirellulales bacterium]|nr:type I-U CRISPR-associated protein Csx17 [Pirellulales bacterium]